jgi:hypothetical protein
MTSRTNRDSEGENQQVGTRLSPAALQRRRQEAMKRYLAGDPIEAICREMGCLRRTLSPDGSGTVSAEAIRDYLRQHGSESIPSRRTIYRILNR